MSRKVDGDTFDRKIYANSDDCSYTFLPGGGMKFAYHRKEVLIGFTLYPNVDSGRECFIANDGEQLEEKEIS